MFDLVPFGHRERKLMNYLENLDRDFFGELTGLPDFRTDIVDKGGHYELRAELPGFNKEDIHINIEGDMLTVSAEHDETAEQKEETYVKRERRYGSYARSFDVSNVDTDHIEAGYKHGILELKLPKRNKPEQKARTIDIQ